MNNRYFWFGVVLILCVMAIELALPKWALDILLYLVGGWQLGNWVAEFTGWVESKGYLSAED